MTHTKSDEPFGVPYSLSPLFLLAKARKTNKLGFLVIIGSTSLKHETDSDNRSLSRNSASTISR